MPDTETTYYVAWVGCWNCDTNSKDLTIPKGTTISEYKCPNCGCRNQLHKISAPEPPATPAAGAVL